MDIGTLKANIIYALVNTYIILDNANIRIGNTTDRKCNLNSSSTFKVSY